MNLLEMKNIYKSFNGMPVLKDVSLMVEAGEVHALLGENGAGKSTLMNILTGVYQRDKGTVVFDGKNYNTMTIAESEKIGIAFVHQELNLFNDLKVYENIFLTNEYTGSFGRLDKKRMIREASELFERMGVAIDPLALVDNLKTSEKQLLEIAKALLHNAKLLILDEPTRGIDVGAKYEIYCIINDLVAAGKSVIMISSELPEVLGMSDRIYVMNEGRIVGELDAAEASQEVIMGRILSSSKGE